MLIDNFIWTFESVQSIIEKKIKGLEGKLQEVENDINRLKSIKSHKEAYKRRINNRISKLKNDLLVSSDKN